MKNTITIIFSIITLIGFSQENIELPKEKKKFSFFWGYNWSAYTPSTLQIEGNGYNYTLHHISAKDRPSPFASNIYFNPTKLSIPQFNTRIGYQWKKKWALSFGYDHMKYVMDANQKVPITGRISSTDNGKYIGDYKAGDSIITHKDFLQFEHTDGLNYFTFQIDNVNQILNYKGGLLTLDIRTGLGIGFLIPRTDVQIFGTRGPNIFNFAGYGTSLKTEFRLQFKKHFFLQATGKAGYINMPHISTTRNKADKASQQFGFIEGFWAIGTYFYL